MSAHKKATEKNQGKEMSAIIRIKKENNYFAVSNQPFNDDRLSWEARGVIGYLLSKPDDWTVRFHDLVKQGPAGDHKLRRILKELKDTGYLERERIQGKGGKFEWQSTIYEAPTISRLSTDGKTTRGLSTRGKPRDIVSTELTNTELTSTNQEEEEKNTFSFYEQEIGPLTPLISERLGDEIDEHSEKWVMEAIKIAAQNSKRSYRYISSILKRWKKEGYGSLPSWEKGEDKDSDYSDWND